MPTNMLGGTYGPNTVSLIWYSWFRLLQMWCEGVCEMHWGLKGSCPQMTCGWQGLWQTGRQVALGSRSRTWVFGLCCTNPRRTHKPRDAHTQSRLSHKDDVLRDLARCTPQAWNGMFPWREEQNYDFKRERSISVLDSLLRTKQGQIKAAEHHNSSRKCLIVYCSHIWIWLQLCACRICEEKAGKHL